MRSAFITGGLSIPGVSDIQSSLQDFDIKNINILLIVVIVVVGLFVWNGYQKGFVRMIISLISMVFWIWIVSGVTPYISDYIKENTDIYELIVERLGETFEENNGVLDNTEWDNHVETINSYNLPGVVKDMLLKNDTKEMYNALLAKVFEEYVSKYLADMIIKAVSFVVAYFIAMLVMKLTLLSAEFIAKLPLISGVNKVAGAVVGFSQGILVIFLMFTVATFLVGRPFYETVRQSRLLSLLYDNNIILMITGGLST